MSFQATSHNYTILLGTQSSSAGSTMLMRPNKAETTAVHGCWLLSSIFPCFLFLQTHGLISSTTVALVYMLVALTCRTLLTLTLKIEIMQ